MNSRYRWEWIQAQVQQTINIWEGCGSAQRVPQRSYTAGEQERSERAYDEALSAVQRRLKQCSRERDDRDETRKEVIRAFARFAAEALEVRGQTLPVLIDEFLPVGVQLAQWARQFDDTLSMAGIIQACRNAWTACGLQPLLGVPLKLTPSILGYSLLYPYSDNYLDHAGISTECKLRFSDRFRGLLSGEEVPALTGRERALRSLIASIEKQYPRDQNPDVFACLLAIHRAQEESMCQTTGRLTRDSGELLRVSCAKGGSSVLADACLCYGSLTDNESWFAFDWGVLLQLGDDLQDIREDLEGGSSTLFSRAAAAGESLDALATQLLNFGDYVGMAMDQLPDGSVCFKDFLKVSWRSLIIRAIADSHQYFSGLFLREIERLSPFRFEFLRKRREPLAGPEGLYSELFNAFLDSPCEERVLCDAIN